MGTRRDGATHTGNTHVLAGALSGLPIAGILAFDSDLRALLLAGDALAELGLPTSAADGSPLSDLIPGERWGVWEPLCRVAAAGGAACADIDGIVDGARMFRIEAGPWRDDHGSIVGGLAIVSDISDRRRAADGLAAELDAFNYSVSHDLRAPLRAIDGFSAALLRRNADALDDAGRDLLSRIRAAVARMGSLIDALLDLSRLSRRDAERVPVDVSEIARDVLGDLGARDPEREVDLVIEPGLEAVGDPDLLRIALANLLENAWKFTSKREDARIELTGTRAGERTTFIVRDNGAGFDITGADRLFAPFQRLHADDEFPGLGIGLATVQRIVRRHGGTIRAEGTPDGGASFSFDLPSAPGATP